MKPTEFKEQNAVFAERQEKYISLPTHKIEAEEGEVISCWKLTFFERIVLLFTGRIWWSQMTFNTALQPQRATVYKSDMFSKEYLNSLENGKAAS